VKTPRCEDPLLLAREARGRDTSARPARDSVSLVTPKQGGDVSPKQGRDVSPKQGRDVSPKQGRDVTPKQGHDTGSFYYWLAANSLQVVDTAEVLFDTVQSKADTHGKVSQRAFCDALHELGIPINQSRGLPWEDVEGAEMDDLFHALDQDGSGLVEMHELRAAIGFIIDPSSDSALTRLVMMDNNLLAASIQRLRGVLKKQASRTMDLFQKWDTDGDGMVNKEEFRVAVTADLGFGALTAGEVDCLFAAFDADASGEISFREMNRMLRVADHGEKKVRAALQVVEPVELGSMRRQMMQDVISMAAQFETRTKLASPSTAAPAAGSTAEEHDDPTHSSDPHSVDHHSHDHSHPRPQHPHPHPHQYQSRGHCSSQGPSREQQSAQPTRDQSVLINEPLPAEQPPPQAEAQSHLPSTEHGRGADKGGASRAEGRESSLEMNRTSAAALRRSRTWVWQIMEGEAANLKEKKAAAAVLKATADAAAAKEGAGQGSFRTRGRASRAGESNG